MRNSIGPIAMGHPDFIVCSFMGNFIGPKRVKRTNVPSGSILVECGNVFN